MPTTIEPTEATLGVKVDAGDWQALSLTTIAANIIDVYHEYTRAELQALGLLAARVAAIHGRPELAEVMTLVHDITADLLPHMLKEEQVLFPYITQLDIAAASGGQAPTPFFGTVKNPVRKMMLEHDLVADLLVRLRAVTGHYTPPENASAEHRELYRRLAEFETRTYQHIHIENHLYFPRAVELEERAGQPAEFSDGCGGGCAH
jgi:regulator of cell morphogenesis and NO signaling